MDWQAIGVVGGFAVNLIAFMVVIWKVSGWVTKRDEALSSAMKEIASHSADIKELARQTRKAGEMMVKLEQIAIQREKDQDRLEGHIDASRRTTLDLNTLLAKAIANLDALWATLQTLHPDKVPKRASDRG